MGKGPNAIISVLHHLFCVILDGELWEQALEILPRYLPKQSLKYSSLEEMAVHQSIERLKVAYKWSQDLS